MKSFSSNIFFMSRIKKERCPFCGFLDTVKFGIRYGHQRYRCNNCGSYFTKRRKDVSKQNRFVWFEWWILRKQTLNEISEQSGYSVRQLKRWFDEYLEKYPEWVIQRRERVNLLIDGTWFPNKACLILYRDETVKTTLFYRLTDDEWEEEIKEDLQNILDLGIEIESITTDGGAAFIKAIKKICPNAKRQRCLAHIQRECSIWLTQRPKSEAGTELRRIVQKICAIETHNDKLYWLRCFNDWYEKHKDYVNAKSFKEGSKNYWYTHKMVRKAYVHIKRALPNMFLFLDDPHVSKTTNALESFFGHLKENISLHRGLSLTHYQNYVKWYLYFRNERNRKDRK